MARKKNNICPRCEKRAKFRKWGYCKQCNNEKRKENAKKSNQKIHCERMGAMMEPQDCVFVGTRCGSCKAAVKGNPAPTLDLNPGEMREQALTVGEESTFPDHNGT